MSGNLLQRSILPGILLALGIFGVDIATPQGVSESTLYILVVLASIKFNKRRVIFGALFLSTLLTVIGFFLSPEGLEPWKSIVNRLFAVCAFWVVGLVGLQNLQAEAGLRESKLRHRNVLDHMLEGAQIIGFDWRYQYVNDTFARQGRQTKESLLGHIMMEAYPGIENTELFTMLRQCMQARLPRLMENEFVFPDGEVRWFELSIQPVPEGLFILSMDITERKHAEANLRTLNRELEQRVAESTAELRLANEHLEMELIRREHLAEDLLVERDLLQTLMDNAPDTIYFKDTAFRFTRINRAQAKVLGVESPAEAIGKTDFDFQDSTLAQGFYEEEQRIVETGEPLINRIEYNPTPDGKPRWFSATKVPIKDEEGRVSGIVGVSRDITLQKQSEETLRQSEERFRMVTWATKDAVWDWNLETNQIQWGAGLQKVFHYRSETAETDSEWWLDHIHMEDREKVRRSLNQALGGGMEFWSKEYRFQRANESYANVMDRGYIIRNEAGKPYRMIGAMIDITERKQAEETIRHQNEMLSSLHYITLSLLRYREVNQLLNALVEFSTTFLDSSYAEIMLVDDDSLVVKATTQNRQLNMGQRLGREEAPLSWQAFDTHEPAVLSDYQNWEQRPATYNDFVLHAVAVFPILNYDQCLGVLAVGRQMPDYEFSSDQIQFGRFFANLTALVLNNVRLREALREQSIRDPLTGLFNRRYMEETLQRELGRMERQERPLGIVMMDLDRFKHFNDTYGHAAGDALLRQVGQFLKSRIRREDVACRYGGEEFILIMPDASVETAQERAEYLRQAVKQLNIRDVAPSHPEITLSLGVAIYPEHGNSAETIVQAADAALYRAKQEGRDQVARAGTT